jgi:hypothetical protein
VVKPCFHRLEIFLAVLPKGESKMNKHPRRRTSRPVRKEFRLKLRPGDRLVTPTVIVTVRRQRRMAGGGFGVSATTTVECECTKGEPNMPDCKPKSTTSPDGHTTTVKCVKSGGCKDCKQTTTTTTTGVFIA